MWLRGGRVFAVGYLIDVDDGVAGRRGAPAVELDDVDGVVLPVVLAALLGSLVHGGSKVGRGDVVASVVDVCGVAELTAGLGAVALLGVCTLACPVAPLLARDGVLATDVLVVSGQAGRAATLTAPDAPVVTSVEELRKGVSTTFGRKGSCRHAARLDLRSM